MSTEPNPVLERDEPNKYLDIGKILVIIVSRWYVLALSLFICVLVAYLQLRYTKPLYSAKLSMKFDDERGSQVNDLFRYGRISGRIENIMKTESEVMKSRTMSEKTLAYMNMYTSAYIEGNFVTSRLYPSEEYFHVRFVHLDSTDLGRSVLISFNNEREYEILKDKDSHSGEKHAMTDTLKLGKSTMLLEIPDNRKIFSIDHQPVRIIINNLTNLAISFSQSVNIDVEKNASIMDLIIAADVPELAADYVNSLAKVYIQQSINIKAQAAEQTVKYIDDQLVELAKRVRESQGELANFKSQNKGMEPTDIGKVEFERLINFETQKNILALRRKQLDLLDRNVQGVKNKPVELIVFDAEEAKTLESLFNLLNSHILERISFGAKNKPESPIMVENEKKINEIKSAIGRTITSLKVTLDNQIADNTHRLDELSEELKGIPSKEQALFNLERNFQINEKIYGYLQERKLENSITMSSITSNATVIDPALVSYSPIYPNPSRNYSIALLIGLAIGLGFIFIRRYFYNKIPDKETIEAASTSPVIGVIKKVDAEKTEVDNDYSIYVFKSPKSVFSESIRGIRTNINFLLKGEKHKVICVTSTVSGEGKTFCTINLAASMTLLGYRVVVVGCDLRRPKLHVSFRNVNNNIGLTTYLVKKSSMEEIIFPTEHENLFVVPAGPTPPNPAELIQTSEFEALIETLKGRFDYIFLDTAPVGLVSDSFPLMSRADINLFILRAQYSKREFATIPDRLKADNNLGSMYIVLNSFDSASVAYSSIYRTGYGGYYGGGGYYYYASQYGRNGYGSYGNSYYSGYYSDEEMNPRKGIIQTLLNLFKKRKK